MSKAATAPMIRFLILFTVLAVAALLPRQAWSDIQYLYDGDGRLTGVIAQDGSAALYSYDATGNITAIERVGAASLSVMEFSPNSASEGAEVTLWGSGFADSASANHVSFNGTSAEVILVSGNRMVVRVPAGATTGRIVVSNRSGNASSRSDFVVAHSNLGPTLTGFTPAIGAAGSEVIVAGSGFHGNTVDNRLRFNGSTAGVRSATGTQLTTQVPALATSGPLSVRTRHGVAESTDDFYVLPAGKTASDVTFTGRVALDAEARVSLAQKKTGLLLFNGTQGQRLYVVASPVECATACALNLVAPNGNVLLAKTLKTPGTFLLAPLAMTGSYTLRLDAPDGAGAVTLSVKRSVALAPDGDAVQATTQRSGENLVFHLQADAGEWLGIGLTNRFSSPSGWARFHLYLPDGAGYNLPVPLNCYQAWSGANRCSLRHLPRTGVYTIVLAPDGTDTVTSTLTVSRDLRGRLDSNGSPYTFATQRAGQNARLSFSASAGDNLAISLSENSFAGPVTVSLWDPKKSEVRGNVRDVTGTGSVLFENLPVSGEYDLLVAPKGVSTGSAKVALAREVRVVLEPDGDTVTLDLRQGQNARLSFTARAGQWLGLGLNANYGTGGNAYVRILAPDGSSYRTYVPNDCSRYWSAADRCALRNLPVDGTYVMEIFPTGVSATRLAVTLSSDASASITPNGEPVDFNSQRPGQNARYTFEGEAGQRMSVALTGNSFPEATSVYLFTPSGSYVSGSGKVVRDNAIDFAALPESGTYSLWVAPSRSHTGAARVRLAAEQSGTLIADGPVTNLGLAPGQNARLTFSARTGDLLALGIQPRIAGDAMGYIRVTVYQPNGKQLEASWPVTCNATWASASRCTLARFPVDGDYTLVLDPEATSSADLSITLTTEARGSLLVNGDPVTARSTRQGQATFINFDAIPGQRHTLHWSGSTFALGRILVLRPDGRTQVARTITNGGSSAGSVLLTDLDGTYTLYVEPAGVNQGSVELRVTSP